MSLYEHIALIIMTFALTFVSMRLVRTKRNCDELSRKYHDLSRDYGRLVDRADTPVGVGYSYTEVRFLLDRLAAGEITAEEALGHVKKVDEVAMARPSELGLPPREGTF